MFSSNRHFYAAIESGEIVIRNGSESVRLFACSGYSECNETIQSQCELSSVQGQLSPFLRLLCIVPLLAKFRIYFGYVHSNSQACSMFLFIIFICELA